MMDLKLPFREDEVYKSIEQFRDFEFTYCIAYEMMIRNRELENLLLKFKECVLFSDEYHCLVQTLEENYFFPFNENSLEGDIYKTLDGLYFKYSFLDNELQEVPYVDVRGFGIEITPNDGVTLGTISESSFSVEQDLKSRKINSTFCRPKLVLKEEVDNSIDIKLNLNLPSEELIAYIKNIKERYDNDNSIIKNPMEILTNEVIKAKRINSKALPKDNDLKKKAFADAFYVYDTYQIIEDVFKKKKNEIVKERDNKIKDIKESIELDSSEKKSLIEDMKNYYKDDLNRYSSTSIKAEVVGESGLSFDKVEKYRALMNKYINEMKYKELLSGITNKKI